MMYTSLLFVLVCSCLSKSPKTTRAEKQAELENSPLSFYLDYDSLYFNNQQPLTTFLQLFEKQATIRLANIRLENDGDSLYSFYQNWGDVTITKERGNRYTILEHYIVPIGSVYGKVALIRYWFNPYKGTVQQDCDFEPQMSVYDYWSNHVVKEYDSYLGNKNFTTKNVETVPYEAREAMRYLMFNLTLAAVLEGCDPCRLRMSKIAKDYPFVADKPYFDQNLSVCKTILGRFPPVKTQ